MPPEHSTDTGMAVAAVLATIYPAYAGGLYQVMVEEILANGYHPPSHIPLYTETGMPFAYPPLLFYVTAALHDQTGLSSIRFSQPLLDRYRLVSGTGTYRCSSPSDDRCPTKSSGHSRLKTFATVCNDYPELSTEQTTALTQANRPPAHWSPASHRLPTNGACTNVTSQSPRPTRPNRTHSVDGSITNMHDVLSDPDRRRILYVLQDADAPVPLADLTAIVESLDEDGTGHDWITYEDGSTVRPGWRLLHEHLVPMAQFGILNYDRDSGTIALSEGMVVSVSSESW